MRKNVIFCKNIAIFYEKISFYALGVFMDNITYDFYFVGTPIGNFDELNNRAIDILNFVDEIYCEDTSHSKVLLSHFNIKKPLYSFHKFNAVATIPQILSKLKDGKKIAYISDAGMPCISDPGHEIIAHLQDNNFSYTVVSGSCALINALILSGMDSNQFTFVGFLGDKKVAKEEKINKVKNLPTTLILYSSVHDINDDLQFLYEKLGDRKVCVVRELTKLYEEKICGKLGEIKVENAKGEFVIVVEGAREEKISNPMEQYELLLSLGYDRKQAMKEVANYFNKSKNEIYKMIEDNKK